VGLHGFAVGLLLKFLLAETDEALQTLSVALTGFGAGIIGVGAVNLFRLRLLKNNPEKARQYDVAEKDERNIRLREKSGYAAWYITMFVLAALFIALLVLDDDLACWLAVCALTIHIAIFFVFTAGYNKKM
jgi:uncharacterized membrane protein